MPLEFDKEAVYKELEQLERTAGGVKEFTLPDAAWEVIERGRGHVPPVAFTKLAALVTRHFGVRISEKRLRTLWHERTGK